MAINEVSFWSKVEPMMDDRGCWEWIGPIDRDGYGRSTNGKTAYRIAYELMKGPVPVGLTLDHFCRNRACVNPAHLEPCSIAENSRRGSTTPLTWDDVEFIRKWYGKISTRSLAWIVGFKSCSAIAMIAKGRRWTNTPMRQGGKWDKKAG